MTSALSRKTEDTTRFTDRAVLHSQMGNQLRNDSFLKKGRFVLSVSLEERNVESINERTYFFFCLGFSLCTGGGVGGARGLTITTI